LSYAYLASLAAGVAAGGGALLRLQRQAASQAAKRDQDLKTVKNAVEKRGGLKDALFEIARQREPRELGARGWEEKARRERKRILDECPARLRVGDLAEDRNLRDALLGRSEWYAEGDSSGAGPPSEPDL
jgi:hypothetical protein